MACVLTQGFNLDCRDSVGGIKEIYLMELANATTVTIASNVVTGITKATSKRFWKYSQVKQTSEWSETENSNEENGTSFWEQDLTIVLQKMQTSVRNEIKLLSQNRLIAVVVDRNSKNWLLGYENGLTTAGVKGGSGKAMGDLNGYTIPFKGFEANPAYEVDDTTLATLETPGV